MNVLLLSRDPALRRALTAALEGEGFTVVAVAAVAAALQAGLSLRVDALISDPLTLTDREGELARLYRTLGTEVRVVELAARGPGASPPRGASPTLRLQRPLDPKQLLEALGRVSPPMASPLHFDAVLGVVSGPRGEVRLTRLQGQLLQVLALAEGHPVAAEELVRRIWGYTRDLAGPGLVRAHIRNLRARLTAVDPGRRIVEMVPGRGYRLARPLRLT